MITVGEFSTETCLYTFISFLILKYLFLLLLFRHVILRGLHDMQQNTK